MREEAHVLLHVGRGLQAPSLFRLVRVVRLLLLAVFILAPTLPCGSVDALQGYLSVQAARSELLGEYAGCRLALPVHVQGHLEQVDGAAQLKLLLGQLASLLLLGGRLLLLVICFVCCTAVLLLQLQLLVKCLLVLLLTLVEET